MLRKHEFMNKYQITEEYLEKNNINWDNLVEIYEDYT